MSHDATMLRAKLRKSLEHIGKSNGHAMPQSDSNIDPVLHELFIAAEGEAYFKTRHADAKATALELVDDIDSDVQDVIDMDQGRSLVGAEGDLYMLTIDIRKPARRLDAKALRNLLQTKGGLSKDVVDDLFDQCMVTNSPAKTVKVASR